MTNRTDLHASHRQDSDERCASLNVELRYSDGLCGAGREVVFPAAKHALDSYVSCLITALPYAVGRCSPVHVGVRTSRSQAQLSLGRCSSLEVEDIG